MVKVLGNIQVNVLLFMMGLILTLANPVGAMIVDYSITLNTSSLGGTSGYLDLQFNPGTIPGTPGAQAITSLFATDGVLQIGDPLTGPIGDVTGSLPGDLTFLNTTMFNDYFQRITFGNSTTFNVNFGGAFLTASSGNHTAFSVSLYDASGLNPLLTTDPSGAVLIFDLAPGSGGTPGSGTTTPRIVNPSVVTATALTAVPLPASAALFLTGLSLFAIAYLKFTLKES